MIKITDVQHIGGYRLLLRFEDGVEGVVDIASQISFEGVFKPMRDPEFFQRVRINRTWGTIEWPGKIDFDPETLYEEVTGRSLVREYMNELVEA